MNQNIKSAKADKGAGGKKVKKKNTKLRAFGKGFLIGLLILTFAVVGLGSGLMIGWVRSAEPLSPEDLQLSKFSSFVYDADGKEIAQLKGDENRIWVSEKDIPENMKNAVLALEDARFYSHPGVDLIGLISATFGKITNPSQPMRGASTLTQQVIKNISGNDERSIKRKLQEQYNALLLEKSLEKWQILELYLNLAVMGPNIYGVQTASQYYFNKDVKDLTLAEAASIAGITNNPSIYSPITTKGRENNKKRQADCLNNMLKYNMITQEEYNQAITEELKFSEGNIKNTSKQSYFVDAVINDVKNDLMTKYKYSEQAAYRIIYSSGIKIYTTQDSKVQAALDSVFTDDKYFPAGNKDKSAKQAAQSSMVIISPENGQVKGLYGGYGEKKADMVFNYATQAKRSPGSTMKPIAVYGPALDLKLITPGTVIDDSPVYLDKNSTEPYPMNYDKTFAGLTPIRDAVRNSVNVVASQVWQKVGADNSLKYLKRSGIDLDKRKDGYLAPMALGALTDGLSPLQLTAAYVPFVNKGMYFEPTTYTKVLDNKGNVLLENKPKSTVVYDDERAAYLMTNMMQDVVANGTAYPYGIIKNSKGEVIPTAGKTGTTSDNKDKWFVGFSTQYVAATWYGYPTPTTIRQDETNNALKIWNGVMTKVLADAKPTEFTRPPKIVEKNICYESGKTPTELCADDPRGSNAIRYGELFIEGTEPKDSDKCDIHVQVKVDKDSRDSYGRKLLAGPNCPTSSIENMVYVKRKVPYDPEKNGGIIPGDFIYELPSLLCQIHNGPGSSKVTATPSPTPGATPKSNGSNSGTNGNNNSGTNNSTGNGTDNKTGSNTSPTPTPSATPGGFIKDIFNKITQ